MKFLRCKPNKTVILLPVSHLFQNLAKNANMLPFSTP